MFSFSLKHFILCNVIIAGVKNQWISKIQYLSFALFLMLHI